MQTLGDSTWTSTVSELILRTVLKRYLSHILCRNPWGNSFLCTLEETLEDLGAEPPCNIWACCSSVDLLRSQENSITHGESGEKAVSFCSFLRFCKIVQCQGSLTKGKNCHPASMELPKWTIGISLDKCHHMPKFVIFYHPHTKNSESEHVTLLRFPIPN